MRTSLRTAFERLLLSLLLAVTGAIASCHAASEPAFKNQVLVPELPRVTVTLTEAVAAALKNFPSIRAAISKARAARDEVTLARTAYLPNLDLVTQTMRTTTNIVAGVLMSDPLNVIPAQSGRESPSSSMRSYFGGNYGANFNWLVWDFGLRHSNVELAKADLKLARSKVNLTELDVAYAAADAYLRTVAAQEVIKAARATLERMEANALTVHTLVEQGLKAGVEAARADFEVASAKIALIESEKDFELSQVELAERMGIAGATVDVVSSQLVRAGSVRLAVGATDFVRHPLIETQAAAVVQAAARVNVLNKTWRPHIWWNSAIWGRGSGAQLHDVAGGVVPQLANYMAGVSVSFPSLDYFEIRARRNRAVNELRAERANLDLAIQILEEKDAKARVLLKQAMRVAEQTPTLVQAARENQVKTLERYKVGLTNIVSVSEAERVLAKAEVDDAIARIRVWQAILAIGYVQSDLRPFLNLVATAEDNLR